MAFQDQKFVQRLVALAKNSPWLMIAIGLHLIIALAMSVVYIHHELQKSGAGATAIDVRARNEAIQEVIQPQEEIDRKKIPESEVQAELVTYEEETTFVPTEVQEEDLYQDIGDPTGSDEGSESFTGGTSIGVGTGGHFGTGAASAFVSRRAGTATRTRKGRPPKGATIGTEEAVLEGLRWLMRHQEQDGSWSPLTLGTHCKGPQGPCIPTTVEVGHNLDEGLTGLALLCFLGQGISIGSKIEIVDTAMGKRHIAGDVVKRGVLWLVDRQHEDGSFSEDRFMYEEALASMAVFEAYGISRNRELKRPAQKAVDFLVAAQKLGPESTRWGWRYSPKSILDEKLKKGELTQDEYNHEGVDISVTGWVVMALKSAALAGLDVPHESLEGALEYARYATGEEGLVGYQNPAQAGQKLNGARDQFTYHTGTMSALGMLVRTFVSQDLDDPFLDLAAKHIVKDLPEVTKDRLSIDYYYWYYATLALNQFDGPDSPRKGAGKYWEPWNKQLIASILQIQDDSKDRDVCTRGGWLVDDRWGGNSGYAIYNTTLSVLTLEVYYRYENAFGLVATKGGAPAVQAVQDKATPPPDKGTDGKDGKEDK